MSEQDFNAGLSGKPFQPGMSLADYDRGVALRLGPKVEVSGIAFTLLMIAPMIWMIYPALGLTLWAVAAGCYFLFNALHVPMHWGFILGFILCVLSFLLGLILEKRASQAVFYRWFRGLVRIGAPLIFVFVGVKGDDVNDFQFFIKGIEPIELVGGFFIGVIAYLIYQRLDLIYFPAKDKIRKLQEKINKGERPKRSMGKRMFYGFCWFVPVMVVLTVIFYIIIRCTVDSPSEQLAVRQQYGPIVGPINAAIWYLLCLMGRLPGTGKYLFSKEHEQDLQQIDTNP